VAGGEGRRFGIWGVAYAIVTVACLGSAAAATFRIRTLNASADWIDTQLRSEESDYEATLQTRYVDQELQGFRERHLVLAASSTWWQIRLALLMFWVLASFSFYVYRVISSFSQEIGTGTQLPMSQNSVSGAQAR